MLTRGLPSVTAMAVSAARGLIIVGGRGPLRPSDDIAGELLPWPIGALVRRASGTPWLLERAQPALRVASLGLFEHVALRTSAIDRALVDALEREAALQLVLLGAGLDARAARMPELIGAAVFEVDHPLTQAYKRKKLENARAPQAEIRWVPVDFERDRLETSLERAGHDAGRASFWIWEGVTPYLTSDAIETTLVAIAARSAHGSTLAMTYVLPELASFARLSHPFVRPAFEVLGEPLRGIMSASAAADVVRMHGFAPICDSGSPEWANRVGAAAPRHVIHERLLIATKGDEG